MRVSRCPDTERRLGAFGNSVRPQTRIERAAARLLAVGNRKLEPSMLSTSVPQANPAVGIGYRAAIDEWTRRELHRFDVLEITVDHCLNGSKRTQSAIFDLVGAIPLTAHGIGLSIGTDVPIDLCYLDRVADLVDRLKAPAYSEHLAFTRVPGRDLANLLPLPQTEAVAESIIAKIRTIQSRIGVPFLLENITYLFTWPSSRLSDAEFLCRICGETGAGLLLDIENLYLNSCNHGFDPIEFIDALPPGLVKEIHLAGGISVQDDALDKSVLADTHSHPVPGEVFTLLDRVLDRNTPAVIILERDERLDAADEILSDVTRIRSHLAGRRAGDLHVNPLIAPADQSA
jgi:uncharacterized protein (UPF0276 family)